MTEQENNKLIAEFMDVYIRKDEPFMEIDLSHDGHGGILFYCEWHPLMIKGTNRIAWDWRPDKNWCQLMPVVEKIEGMGYRISIATNSCSITSKTIGNWEIYKSADTKLSAVYQAVITFIKNSH